MSDHVDGDLGQKASFVTEQEAAGPLAPTQGHFTANISRTNDDPYFSSHMYWLCCRNSP